MSMSLDSERACIPFLQTAHKAQLPPENKKFWRNWLFMGGRGAGKTRAGAEWLRFSMLFGGCRRACLAGPTFNDVREVMIEGASGLMNLDSRDELRPEYNASRKRLEWPNGAAAYALSAEDQDGFRGPQFDVAWCDELAVWKRGEAVWDTMQLGVRLGVTPKVAATTTPRPNSLIRRLHAGETKLTTASTQQNSSHLAEAFIEQVERDYGHTHLGRQELGGELLEDSRHAYWSRTLIERSRRRSAPDLFDDLIIAVDPPITSGEDADACGIVAAGVTGGNTSLEQCYILKDASTKGDSPLEWAKRVVDVANETGASRIVAEANQGGELVSTVLRLAGCGVPIKLVHAKLGKHGRAVPIAALYRSGKVSHVGLFSELEDEMCTFGTSAFSGSPDRMDALVWAVTELMISNRDLPRARLI